MENPGHMQLNMFIIMSDRFFQKLKISQPSILTDIKTTTKPTLSTKYGEKERDSMRANNGFFQNNEYVTHSARASVDIVV